MVFILHHMHFLRNNRWVRHILIWLLYWSVNYFFNVWKSTHIDWKGHLLLSFLLTAVFYLLYKLFRVIDHKATRKKGVFWLSASMILLALLAWWYVDRFIPGLGGMIERKTVPFKLYQYLRNYLLIFFRVFGYAFLYFLYRTKKEEQEEKYRALEKLLAAERDNRILELKAAKVERERADFRMRFYRAQIYPHFLRSTLTGLLMKARSYQDEWMISTIDNLNKVLNYVLWHSKHNEPVVFIHKELDFLKAMILLMRKQAGSEQAVQFRLDGAPEAQVIPPLSLLTFLENVLKHGVFSVAQPLEIKLVLEEAALVFFCRNAKRGRSLTGKKNNKNGLGMKNVYQRLKDVFQDRFTVRVEEEENYYTIMLTINYSNESYAYMRHY